MLDTLDLIVDPQGCADITIIEGCDGVGKTTLINQIKAHYDTLPDYELRVIRFPDNHGNARFRDLIMSNELAEHSQAIVFLFVADFVYTYKSKIEPHLGGNVRFLLDRFLPSTCVYQKASLDFVESMIEEQSESMFIDFSEADYIYLVPDNMDNHLARLAKKKGEEVNHLDPKTQEAVEAQIEAYNAFIKTHKAQGILGSYNVKTYLV